MPPSPRWCDELAKWERPGETWDMLQLGLRLGDWPRALVTTTPRPGPHLRRIMDSPGCVTTGGPTRANPHLSPAWQANVHALYAGTRLARQELEGELLTDSPGALWTVELLERCRIGRRNGNPVRPEPVEGPSFASAAHAEGQEWASRGSARTAESEPTPAPSTTWRRIVIAVDPPSGAGTCGIIACAKDSEGRAHVLADHSVTARTPEGWATAVATAARIHAYSPLPSREREGAAQRREGEGTLPVQIVAESNQGGQMVASVLRIADAGLRVKLVTAHQGKTDRAAPVAMLFEAGKVTLHGRFPELEAELLGMIAGGEYEGPGNSPDRADAMVWGLTELMLGPGMTEPRVRTL